MANFIEYIALLCLLLFIFRFISMLPVIPLILCSGFLMRNYDEDKNKIGIYIYAFAIFLMSLANIALIAKFSFNYSNGSTFYGVIGCLSLFIGFFGNFASRNEIDPEDREPEVTAMKYEAKIIGSGLSILILFIAFPLVFLNPEITNSIIGLPTLLNWTTSLGNWVYSTFILRILLYFISIGVIFYGIYFLFVAIFSVPLIISGYFKKKEMEK